MHTLHQLFCSLCGIQVLLMAPGLNSLYQKKSLNSQPAHGKLPWIHLQVTSLFGHLHIPGHQYKHFMLETSEMIEYTNHMKIAPRIKLHQSNHTLDLRRIKEKFVHSSHK
jgi:hypothetical protein